MSHLILLIVFLTLEGIYSESFFYRVGRFNLLTILSFDFDLTEDDFELMDSGLDWALIFSARFSFD